MNPRLKSLSIQNFRSIRGSVVIPLDAQVVLVHGTNGMGKTSVMSAIELGLTGSIAHLEDQSKYHDFLTHIDTNGGDSLITVEISRNFVGDAVADPHFYVFEDDKAVAA